MWDKSRISSRQKLVLVIQIKSKHNVLLITVSKGAFKKKRQFSQNTVLRKNRKFLPRNALRDAQHKCALTFM